MLTQDEHNHFVDAAFQLMWAIQRADFARSTIKPTGLAVREGKWLYRQLESIVPELQDAINLHGKNVNLKPTLTYTNEVLDKLPDPVRNSFGLAVAAKRFGPLRAPSGPYRPTVM